MLAVFGLCIRPYMFSLQEDLARNTQIHCLEVNLRDFVLELMHLNGLGLYYYTLIQLPPRTNGIYN
jgi:hypothetical protein